jgi:hypothetical protein
MVPKPWVGAELMRSAEDWARAQGCLEMASDALINNEGSLRAHEALGFEIVDRGSMCISATHAPQRLAARQRVSDKPAPRFKLCDRAYRGRFSSGFARLAEVGDCNRLRDSIRCSATASQLVHETNHRMDI